MKTLFFTSFYLLLLSVNAQSPSSATIDANNFSAKFFANGMISYDGSNANFTVPKDSGVQALFAGNLWIAGFDNTFGVLHASTLQYDDSTTNYRFGPIANSYNSAYALRYNKVWKLKQSDITYHVLHYSDIGYTTPQSILDYPANGNTSNGEPALLAPFADLNGNFLYEPGTGEYPLVKGDEALYIIYSDRANPNNVLYGNPLNVDVHLMVYAYDNSHGEDLWNTLFLHYNIINRNNDGYRDVLIGSWSDFDLGCFSNDRVGCDSVLNSYFVYNEGNDIDCNGVEGYGSLRASLGVTLLNQPMYAFGYFSNGSIWVSSDPASPFQKYYAMNALWNDGTHFSEGDVGYGGSYETNYLFAGNPCTPAEWSETSTGLPSGDRRALGSMGKFHLAQGANICVDLAYVFAKSSSQAGCNYDAVDSLKRRIQFVKSFYNSAAPDCNNITLDIDNFTEDNTMSVYSNPSADGSWALEVGSNLIGGTVEVFDANGRVVYKSEIRNQRSEIALRAARGVYLLRISSAKSSVVRKLVRL